MSLMMCEVHCTLPRVGQAAENGLGDALDIVKKDLNTSVPQPLTSSSKAGRSIGTARYLQILS